MPRRSPPAALVAVLLVVVLAASGAGGWLIAQRVSDDAPRTASTTDPAEPPYDAGDPLDPPPAPAGPLPGAAPAAPAPATPPAPADPGSPPASPAGDASPPSSPAPRPPPAPVPAPAPAPAAPAPAPPDRTTTPYDPPPAIGIAAEALPSEGQAWASVLAARRQASPGSQERADLDWLVDFARSAAAPGRPEGRRATARRVLRVNGWWYGRRAAPAQRVIARDPDGVILTYKRGHGFMMNPVATLGRWRGLNELWTPAQLADAMMPMLVERTHEGREWAALEYFDVPGEPRAVRPGVSGMAQARGAALFARAYRDAGDPRFLDAAQRLLRSFSVPVAAGGALAQVPDPQGGAPGPWYPERAYPGRPAWTGGALNGFMVTIIELRRAARSLGSATAGELATDGAAPQDGAAPAPTAATTGNPSASPPAGTTTPLADDAGAADAARLARVLASRGEASLARFLPLHDSGDWSYYGLLTPGRPWRSYLADLNYHCYHVSLLRTLHRLYPAGRHGAVADRWQGYVDAKGVTCPAR